MLVCYVAVREVGCLCAFFYRVTVEQRDVWGAGLNGLVWEKQRDFDPFEQRQSAFLKR